MQKLVVTSLLLRLQPHSIYKNLLLALAALMQGIYRLDDFKN